MAILQIKKGDLLPVKVALEFEGTIHNSLVNVEEQVILLKGDVLTQEGQRDIRADADPIHLVMVFTGEIGSTVKTYKLTINDIDFENTDPVKLKSEQIRIEVHIPYSFFDLQEAGNNAAIPGHIIALGPVDADEDIFDNPEDEDKPEDTL